MRKVKRSNTHRIDNQTKSQLSKNFKPMFKGLVLFFDDVIINKHISWSAKLVYAGLYFSVPKAARYGSIARKEFVTFKKSKNELIENLGIARSTFYEAIRELEQARLITTEHNKYSQSFYYLHHELELNQNEIKATVTSEMLKRAYVKTNSNNKTYSPYVKIILGQFENLSRGSYTRVVQTSAKEISEDLNIPQSTVYYLIRQFMSNSTMSIRRKEAAVFTLLMLDEYVMHQHRINKETSGTHSKKQTPLVKNKEPEIPSEAIAWMDAFMNS